MKNKECCGKCHPAEKQLIANDAAMRLHIEQADALHDMELQASAAKDAVRIMEDACVAVYMADHVSSVRTTAVNDVWKIGQEIYMKRINQVQNNVNIR